MAWIVAIVATLGSLYFSEVAGFIPCEKCWYQRILMYPLALILGIAAYDDYHKIRKYVLPLSILGMIISAYHYLIQKVPGIEDIKPCVSGIPCSQQWINWFGFITIPFLAFVAFTLITILMFMIGKGREHD